MTLLHGVFYDKINHLLDDSVDTKGAVRAVAAPASSSPAAKVPPGSSVAAATLSKKKLNKFTVQKYLCLKEKLIGTICGYFITSDLSLNCLTQTLS